MKDEFPKSRSKPDSILVEKILASQPQGCLMEERSNLDESIQYVKLAKTSDFDSTRIKSFRILARPVGIVRSSDGTFFATEISCKHQNADLSAGLIKGDFLTCPRHGWRYNLETGECVNHDSTPLRRYALKVEDGDIFVSLLPISSEGDYA